MLKAWCMLGPLLVAGLAGCAGDPAPASTGEDDVELPGGTVVGADMAVLQGTVYSDAGLRVPGARVFVPGTGFDHATGDSGAFRFVNVSAGSHTLRVEAEGFRVHEQRVSLVAATVTDVNVTLLPSTGLGGAYRPHVHDYWAGRSEVLLVDHDIDLRELRVGSVSADSDPTINWLSAAVIYANTRYPKYAVPLPDQEEGTPSLVYPGTARVEATLTWDDAPPMPPTYAFGYRPADRSDEVRFDAGPSGTTWAFDVLPGQADNGHQMYSLWEFYIIPDNDVRSAPDYRPTVVTETVHLRLKVIRGNEPPVEPPHPTFWNDGDVLELRSLRNDSFGSTGITAFGSNPKFIPADGKIVPPGTARLLLELVWKYDVPTPLDIPYELYYHTAATSPVTDYFVRDWPKAGLVEEGAGRRVYEIELDPGDADGYYQERTAWRFAARPEGHDPDGITPDHYRGRTINLAVTAYRDSGAASL